MRRQSVLRGARRSEGRGGRSSSQADARFAFCRARSSGCGESWSDAADVVFWSCNPLIPRLIGLASFPLLTEGRPRCFLLPGSDPQGCWWSTQRCRCCTRRWFARTLGVGWPLSQRQQVRTAHLGVWQPLLSHGKALVNGSQAGGKACGQEPTSE